MNYGDASEEGTHTQNQLNKTKLLRVIQGALGGAAEKHVCLMSNLDTTSLVVVMKPHTPNCL